MKRWKWAKKISLRTNKAEKVAIAFLFTLFWRFFCECLFDELFSLFCAPFVKRIQFTHARALWINSGTSYSNLVSSKIFYLLFLPDNVCHIAYRFVGLSFMVFCIWKASETMKVPMGIETKLIYINIWNSIDRSFWRNRPPSVAIRFHIDINFYCSLFKRSLLKKWVALTTNYTINCLYGMSESLFFAQ